MDTSISLFFVMHVFMQLKETNFFDIRKEQCLYTVCLLIILIMFILWNTVSAKIFDHLFVLESINYRVCGITL